MKDLITIKQKQNLLIKSYTDSGRKLYDLKVSDSLSPIGWHLIHCLYIECIWIRKLYYNDTDLVNKLKNNGDSVSVPIKKRGENLPEFQTILSICRKEFKKNLNLIEKISNKKIKKNNYNIAYILRFLINHHSQHLETIKSILNLIKIKNTDYLNINFKLINPQEFKFDPLVIKEGIYKFGAKDSVFSYDNEKPINNIKLGTFGIAKNLISVGQWLGFIIEEGYNRKELWKNKGWAWKNKNNITKPLNWIFLGNQLSLCTPKGHVKPKETQPVTNISMHELEAFAKWQNLRVPHELEWEIAAQKFKNKYLVWEWCRNKFYPYKGFVSFPYEGYSRPWFDNNYYTLRGSSVYSEEVIKRSTFRNFYKPDTRYIFSGGRLSSS